jgi:transposase
MSNLTGLIYIIKNKINNKVYIGQTTMDMKTRFIGHISSRNGKNKKHYKFYKAIRAIGKEYFYYEIIEKNIPVYALDEKEIAYIKKFNSYHKGYNSTAGGDSPLIYKIDDQETVLDMLKAGFHYTELAELYGVHKVTIQRLAHKLGHRQNFKIKNKDFIKDIENGLTNQEIAIKYDVNIRTVTRKRTKMGLNLKRKPLSKRNNFNKNHIINDWLNADLSVNDVCKRHNITISVLRRFLKENKIPNIFRKSQTNWITYIENDPNFNFKQFKIDLFVNKLKIDDLALKYNTSKSTVSRIIKRNNLR